MSNVKNYNVGEIIVDLPTPNYYHELPLLSFGDIHGSFGLSLIFNFELKAKSGSQFYMLPGFKLNVQKRIIMKNNAPYTYQGEDGKIINLNSSDILYAFNDESHRILRRTGSTYSLEYPDFSKETYDQLGRISAKYDKYGASVISYSYDSSGRLASITYRGSKTINLSYDASNRLHSIAYAGKTITLSYVASTLIINHYTGVTYNLVTSGMNYTATATGVEDSETISYSTQIVSDTDLTLVVSNIDNGTIVDTTTYKFPGSVTSYSTQYTQVEITDNYGIRKRVQYKENKALYSYEIGATDAEFVDETYPGTVQVHSVFNNASGIYSGGALGVNDGCRLSAIDASTEISWNTSLPDSDEAKGIYLLSGWYRILDENYSGETIPLNIAENIQTLKYKFDLPKYKAEQWAYFCVGFPYEKSTLSAYIKKYHGDIETKDFRLRFQAAQVLSSEDSSFISVSQDILFYHRDATPIVIPINGLKYTCGTLDISSYGRVYYEDLLRYKMKQIKGSNLTEFYYNKVKRVLTTSPSLPVMVSDNNGSFLYDLSDCYLGKRVYTKTGVLTTVLKDDVSDSALVIETFDEDNMVIARQTFNNKFDIMSAMSDGITTFYERNNDLIINEELGGIIRKQTSYSEDDEGNPTITKIDEFSKSTVITLDPTWGFVKKVTLPNGNVIVNEYDESKNTLISIDFSRSGAATRKNEFEYKGGKLDCLKNLGITYNFSYDNGNLSSVKKYGTDIEQHLFTNNNKILTSFYPSQDNQEYIVVQNRDDYGRLNTENDKIKVNYDVNPTFSNNSYVISNVDNGSSKIASIEDLVTGNKTKFAYENGRLSKTAEFNSSGAKRKEETFTFDNAGRMVTDSLLLKNPSFTLKSEIDYVTEADSQNADGRILSYGYNINNTRRATTTNRYNDNFKRLSSKLTNIGGRTYEKGLIYSKTRISRVIDIKSGVLFHDISYTYDVLGRIASESDSVNTNNRRVFRYDSYGRLAREDNKSLDKTILYEYNDIGCLMQKKTYPFSTTSLTGTPTVEYFGHSSPNYDRPTSYCGKNIAYNSLGAITVYGGQSFSWSNGKLSGISSGSLDTRVENHTFQYNALGQRTRHLYSLTQNATSTTPVQLGEVITCNKSFTYDNSGRLVSENISKSLYSVGSESTGIYYLYDEDRIVGMYYTSGSSSGLYYFHRNLFGDVVAIYNSGGNKVAGYDYDAWGNCTITSDTTDLLLARTNPIRYRGYYYDEETGLYWVSSRYYSPELCMFISPDSIEYLDPESVNGLNLYAYCGNDPVNRFDPTGHSWKSFWNGVGDWFSDNWIKLAIGTGVVIAGAFVTAITCGTGLGFFAAFGGALLTSAKAVAISTAISAGIGLAVGGITTGSWEGALDGMLDGIADGFMWGGIFAGGAQILSGAFKAYAQVANHYNKLASVKKSPFFSPDRLKSATEIAKIAKKGQSFYDYGGIIVRFGRFAHIDASTKSLLHLAALGFNHIPIGTIVAGFIGGF